MAQVEVYGTRFCPYCVAARQLLERKGVAFDDIRVDAAPQRRDEMNARGGDGKVPQIWIGSQHVGGFTDMLALERQGALDALLQRESEQ